MIVDRTSAPTLYPQYGSVNQLSIVILVRVAIMLIVKGQFIRLLTQTASRLLVARDLARMVTEHRIENALARNEQSFGHQFCRFLPVCLRLWQNDGFEAD